MCPDWPVMYELVFPFGASREGSRREQELAPSKEVLKDRAEPRPFPGQRQPWTT